jgi:selenocysteine-specific elongation factor
VLFERAIACPPGDRFLLRDHSALRTPGGGAVVDPFAPAARRNSPTRQKTVAAMTAETAEDALRALSLDAAEGIDVAAFEAAFNLDAAAAAALYAKLKILIFGRTERLGIPAGRRDELCQAIEQDVQRLHRDDPKSLGVELASLPQRLGLRLPEWLLSQLARELAQAGKVEVAGTRVRRPGHDATSNPEDEKLWQRILPALQKDAPLPPSIKELAEQLRLPDKSVADLLHRKSRGGEPIKVMPDRFLLRSTVQRLAETAESTARSKPNGQFTAADYRDHCGASRKLSIEVLEYFDRIGFTQRIGDVRRIRRPLEQALAAAPGQVRTRP